LANRLKLFGVKVSVLSGESSVATDTRLSLLEQRIGCAIAGIITTSVPLENDSGHVGTKKSLVESILGTGAAGTVVCDLLLLG